MIDNRLMVTPDHNPAMLDMFADRDRQPYRSLLPWSGEFAGEYLMASTEIIRLTRDATTFRRTVGMSPTWVRGAGLCAYTSWLTAATAPSTPFSAANPLRSSILEP